MPRPMIAKRRILITGGAGFLGRAILRRAHRDGWGSTFIVYSRDEHKQAEIKRRWPDALCVLGDVRDTEHLATAAMGCDVIIHAAAMKFIPEAEFNVLECSDVNIGGAQSVVVAAARAGVRTVVGLSTDKAAAPLNTYGATKLMMERIFGEADRVIRDVCFKCVRYGNVVSSSGSVIPVFRQQLEEHGSVYVTDERMTRFWLSVDDAIDLIVKAANDDSAVGPLNGGAVYVPKCKAMPIVEIARLVAGEAPIEFTGLRPGEKLHETLVLQAESPRTDEVDGGYIIAPPYSTGRWSSEFEYTSDHPVGWISREEMAAMIADSQELM